MIEHLYYQLIWSGIGLIIAGIWYILYWHWFTTNEIDLDADSFHLKTDDFEIDSKEGIK